MLRLANKNVGPPGSFRYHVAALAEKAPLLSWVGPFHCWSDLVHEVEKRCKANGVTVPSPSEIEDQLCQSLPPGYCLDDRGRPTVGYGSGALSLADITQGTKTLLTWFRNGRRRVSKDEVVRRSYICNGCPFHTQISGCKSCSGNSLRTLVNEIVVNDRLPTDGMLQACGICHCSLQAKVRMELTDIVPHMSDHQKERLWDKCWIREGF